MLMIIDYDETFTEDLVFWSVCMATAKKRGHTVICCTMRPQDDMVNKEMLERLNIIDVPIIYAALYSDKWEAVQEAGYNPKDAIWIDDRPMYIFMNRPMDEWPD